MTTTRTGSTRAWRRTRAYVLARDGWTCRTCRTPLCPRQCTPPCPTCPEAGHITPRARHGSDDPTNLIAQCRHCNLTLGDALGVGGRGHRAKRGPESLDTPSSFDVRPGLAPRRAGLLVTRRGGG